MSYKKALKSIVSLKNNIPSESEKSEKFEKPNVKLNPEHGKTIAGAYGKMSHNPSTLTLKELTIH